MIRLEERIVREVNMAMDVLFEASVPQDVIQVQRTRKDMEGDLTLVVFPLLKWSKKTPEQTGSDIGDYIMQALDEIASFKVIKGFLNLRVKESYWLSFLNSVLNDGHYGQIQGVEDSPLIVVEYSSPNTNKPLHLGHIRNNLLGFSVSQLLKASGRRVNMVNLVNDRGIHICKSMIAWQKWGKGCSPESTGIKGDRLVGDYYVKFDKEYKREISTLVSEGMSVDQAEKQAPLMIEAQVMLREWENGNPEVIALWEKMNQWVYQGFNTTYAKLGITFDKIYYESNTYKLGRSLVEKGLETGVLIRKEDGSIWADLTQDGLDQKLLLRSDGTSVYMTQDLGTAQQRYQEFYFDNHVYVVGNEQNYHFKVLSLILKKLGFAWADKLYHLSYGMVELPEGKMKSREGSVVDADDLIDEMVQNAEEVSNELGKLEDFTEDEKRQIYFMIAMGALKYFILKVDPQKTMMFNPKESIDFAGNTGPFIQYTYVRIKSIERKAIETGLFSSDSININISLNEKEVELLKKVYSYPEILQDAARQFSPAIIANYTYDLVKEFNQFYQQSPVLKEENESIRNFRLQLSGFIARHLSDTMKILGIDMPERM